MDEKANLSWIFFDKSEISKMEEWLHFYEQEGSLDQMGLGILRDYFSDELFPAITTIHTRIKYLFFIPAMIIEWQENKKSTSYNDVELALKKRLMRNMRGKASRTKLKEKYKGIIGHTKGKNGLPSLWPTEIYWSSLSKLRIIDIETTVGDFIGDLESIKKFDLRELTNDENGVEPNDEAESIADTIITIDKSLKEVDEILKKKGNKFWHSWKLNLKQAKHLKLKYENEYKDSFFYYLLCRKTKLPDEFDKLKRKGDSILEDAKKFSFITAGVYKFFNYFLLYKDERNKGKVKNEITKDDLIKWVEEYNNKRKDLIILLDFKKYDSEYKNILKKPSSLLNKFQELILRKNWVKENNLKDLEKLLMDREKQCKGQRKSKFYDYNLIDPQNDFVNITKAYYFDFRWRTAKKHLEDIRDGLQ